MESKQMKQLPKIETITTIDRNGNKVQKGGLWRERGTGNYFLETIQGEWILLTHGQAKALIPHQYERDRLWLH